VSKFFNVASWKENGAVYAIVDGQFGSTGKGVLAAYLASLPTARYISRVVSNAGPNSGHTSYYKGEKIVLKQLPTFSVIRRRMGLPIMTHLSAGAIIDAETLHHELAVNDMQISVSPQAALINKDDQMSENDRSDPTFAVAGTRKGVGAALARKIKRDPSAAFGYWYDKDDFHEIVIGDPPLNTYLRGGTLLEVSQGFSLGINSHFYPKVTSRECTVTQALADARIAPQLLRGVAMCIRSYPIRVGNADGHSSGDCYPDQQEIGWGDIGVEPELTTVTKRPRRIFTFSEMQYTDALLANRPTLVFCNFINYLTVPMDRDIFAKMLRERAQRVLGYEPEFIFGHGPKTEDVSEHAVR